MKVLRGPRLEPQARDDRQKQLSSLTRLEPATGPPGASRSHAAKRCDATSADLAEKSGPDSVSRSPSRLTLRSVLTPVSAGSGEMAMVWTTARARTSYLPHVTEVGVECAGLGALISGARGARPARASVALT